VSAILTIIGVFFHSSRSSFQKMPLESMQGASGGSQINYLLLTTLQLLSENVGINYIFFSNRLCYYAPVKRGRFRTFLNSGNEVMKLLHIIMTAPVGLRALLIKWNIWTAIIWCVCKTRPILRTRCISISWYSLVYMPFGRRKNGLKVWGNNITPALTALGTCSSIATIPRIWKQQKMKVPTHIRNIAIPLGLLCIKTVLVCHQL
jgi:hypothetical protein